MKYVLAIYGNEKIWQSKSKEEIEKEMSEYWSFEESIKKTGNYIAGEALKPVATATTVRIRDGKRVSTDGPFAETREQLGGFYLVEAKDLDEALAIASRIPSAKDGSIEVRPCENFEQQ